MQSRLKRMNGQSPRVIFGCKKAGKHVPQKNVDPDKHRNCTSSRECCPCQIVVRSPRELFPRWRITSLVTDHCHELKKCDILESNQRDKRLSAEMLQLITTHAGKCDPKFIVYMLQHEWPDKAFDLRTVANAIQKAKNSAHIGGSEAAELHKILQDKTRNDKDWFFATDLDENGRLRRMFWMSPSQRYLYRRYRDVVISDNTYKTNRFGMPLNVIVIIDNAGKSRLVGCSLVSGESVEDYEWILEQLLAASDNVYPHIIFVDEDPAMEAACATTISKTTVLNCIWHLRQNLNKNLHGALGKDWNDFISAFWTTRNALTASDFERRWSEHVAVFGVDKPKIEGYLKRISEKREHWAWPWVGTRFTAGMQSTQRVESMNAAIKRAVNGKTSLPALFEAIEKKLSNEAQTSKYILYKTDTTVDPATSTFVQQMFADVIDANNRYLGIAAKSQMKLEMSRSVLYQSNPHTGIDACAPRSIEGGDFEEIERSSKDDREMSSLQSIQTIVGSDRIVQIFDVTFRLDTERKSLQHILLLADGSYICTCLLLQNSGFVCRHYFHLMQVSDRCKYHVRLIPMRWFKEELQDLTDLDLSGAFLSAKTQKTVAQVGSAEGEPASSFMSDIMKVFPSVPSLSGVDKRNLSKKRRIGEISGLMKNIMDTVNSNPEVFETVKDGLNRVIVRGAGEEGMKDPHYTKTKGRPRTSRIKSSMETKKKSTKCGVCSGEGHNSRQHS
ncbi:zinc finger SWIM domain-containing protein 3 [Entomortierella parvispora]|nr:zinc finger SWIM domain-containing protein 3 [Entomortierella parvispora]GJJ76636.1 zinc finger SWIM domain-containing protein 3 [Entomortierella parvispora]